MDDNIIGFLSNVFCVIIIIIIIIMVLSDNFWLTSFSDPFAWCFLV